mgnify:CR=1 FL=1
MDYRNDGISNYEKKPENILFTAGCRPLCYYYDYDKVQHIEHSNKIIMPMRILERLSKYENLTTPFTFEIISDKDKYICSAYEFVIGLDAIYVPHCILERIQVNDSNIVAIRYIDKPFVKGTKVVIQPHTSNFLELENHKTYLEQYLNNYTLLKKNTMIVLPDPVYVYNIYFNIIETEPADIISTVDTDLEVEFKAPLDYVEKPKPITFTPAPDNKPDNKPDNIPMFPNKPNNKNTKKKFIPFSGKGHRLGD